MEDKSVRLDKWLWAVRIYKTRSDAADACRTNKVLVNGSYAKPSREVKPGDAITVKKMPVTYSFRVVELVSSRQPAKEVPRYAENGKFLSWVLRIAHNQVIDHFRKKSSTS